MVILTIVSVTARRGEMFSIAQFTRLYAVVETVEFGLWRLLETLVNALPKTIDGNSALGVAGGGS